MKKFLLGAGAGLAVLAGGCARVEKLDVTAPSVEVLVAPNAPKTTLFAADELTNFLAQVFHRDIPLVTAPTTGKTAIVLGTNGWSSSAGIDVSVLKRDGFFIRTDAASRRIYIAGGDDPTFDLRTQVAKRDPDHWSRDICEHATLFGVYDFLERFVGIRFYFPGEMGTIVPTRSVFSVPAGTIRSEPDWSVRIVFPYEFGEWPEPLKGRDLTRAHQLEQFRLRAQTETIPGCHGQYYMNMAKRFGTTHPEYFVMKEDGSRMTNASGRASLSSAQHLCQSSKVWDEIYKDAKSYFSGESADRRGALSGFDDRTTVAWGKYAYHGKYYDVMPHDGMPLCACADCKAAYAKAKDPTCPVSELLWCQTATCAKRLKDAGVKGVLSQAAYARFRSIPEVEIPDNVIVNLAETGPWSFADPEALEKEYAEVRAWSEKAHGNIWMWIYPGKFRCFSLDLPDIPMCATKSWIKYLKTVAPHVLGVFPELGSEKFLFHHLDLYLYSRIAWDNRCGTREILDEYFRLMYGAGGAAMEEFFDEFERIWLGKIVGKATPTPWGYSFMPPDEYRLMTEAYPPKEIERFEAILARALSAVGDGSMEAKRIRFMGEKFLGPLAARSRGYLKTIDPKTELDWRTAHPGANLVINGSFDSFEKWGRNLGDFEIDKSVFFSAPSSFRISTSDSSPAGKGPYTRAMAYQGLKLKPNTVYRLSCFVRLDGVVPLISEGGFNMLLSGPAKESRTYKALAGTRDWFPYVIEFKTAREMKPGAEVLVCPRISMAYGTAWIDDVRLEEIR